MGILIHTDHSFSSPVIPRTVMVHLFEWKWKDIANECESYLGPNGFSAVQVSPPNEHAIVSGFPWYQRYQPVSYKLESRSGNRVQFIDMVQRCQKVGVDIYVDAVINHMSGVVPEGEIKKGSAGSDFSFFKYPDYSFQDFHHCGLAPYNNIDSYSVREKVQNCQLVGLADLDTESSYVQNRLRDYLKDLIQIGVKGFRIDAAKHISSQSLNQILKGLPDSTYIYQEVIDQGSEPIKATEYLNNGDVTEFNFGLHVSSVLLYGKLALFNQYRQFSEGSSYLPSDKAIVFIDNHDNQRGHGGGGEVLTYKHKKKYELAQVLMLAWPYGYPQLMSSYEFTDGTHGPPSNSIGETFDVHCGQGWVCEHRSNSAKVMVNFRNRTQSQFFVSNWWSNGENQMAFSRGNLGFVAINNENFNMKEWLQTGLSQGNYCNELSRNSQGTCVEVISVNEQGFAEISVLSNSALVLIK